MIQSCASETKLRGGGPILNRGSKTMSTIGLPTPRLVICISKFAKRVAESFSSTSAA